MLNSIIIPHRDRNDYLEMCLWWLLRSSRLCDCGRWEVLVVDSGSAKPPGSPDERVLVIHDPHPPPIFNKSRCLNLGIRLAKGQVLSFLDADMMAGSRFLEGWRALESNPALSRVCYRVRSLEAGELRRMMRLEGRDGTLAGAWQRYNEVRDGCDSYRLLYEAYGRYDRVRPPDGPAHQPWGNSQFSIRRETLGDLRFDEAYSGHGYEDQDLLMRLSARLGDAYRGLIWTDAEHALLHLEHGRGDWRRTETTKANWDKYTTKRKQLLGR